MYEPLRVDRDRAHEEEQSHGCAHENADDEHEAVEELLIVLAQRRAPELNPGRDYSRRPRRIEAHALRPCPRTRYMRSRQRSCSASATCSVVTAVAAGEIGDRSRDLQHAQRAARAELPAVGRALQQRSLRRAERDDAPQRARIEPRIEPAAARRAARARAATDGRRAADADSRARVGSAMSANGTRGTSTCRSKRSSSGPEIRPRYCSSLYGVHWQRSVPSPRKPQKHGFIAPTSMNSAGNASCSCTREIRATPLSSGSRSASSAPRRELGQLVQEQHAAVRERDLARPRPRAAADERLRARSCDAARETAASTSAARRAARRPPTRCSRRAASRRASSGGSRPLNRSASMLLPLPGGPIISRLWPPAAATTSARFANA